MSRAAIGAVAGGAKRLLVIAEPFRISTSAVENLDLDAEIEVLDIGAELRAADTSRAIAKMREADCGALIVLGGDGTQRIVAKTWRDAPLVPLSTGTNNVFPLHVEATAAGLAAGLVASARVPLAEVSRPVKVVHVLIEGEPPDLAVIDAVLLIDDAVGNFMPFEPRKLRRVVLARAEPSAVGMSPIGGLLHPCGDRTTSASTSCVVARRRGRTLWRRLRRDCSARCGSASAPAAFGEAVAIDSPGVLAFDGDREQSSRRDACVLSVSRDGPRRIDVDAVLARAARDGGSRRAHGTTRSTRRSAEVIAAREAGLLRSVALRRELDSGEPRSA